MNAIDRPRRELANGVTMSALVVSATGEHYGDRRVWRLMQDFRLSVSVDGERESYMLFDVSVPEGFLTDYASVPRCFWRLWSHDECAEAAVIHDWLYSQPEVDRHLADTILRLVMQLTGKPKLMQWAFYLAVRFGGRWARKTRKVNS